ncbi:MAG: ABC transporter substrate-binding protein, partial [Bdellovibrionales bacterium]|nr:ABC transporter substrate-binding protein [Bdellovibrionales bacterium]
KQTENFQVYKYPGLAMTYLLTNLKDPNLKDIRLRKALALSLNRDEIIQYKLEGLGEKATSLLTPTNPYFNSKLKPIPYDLKESKKIIKDLGLEGHEFKIKSSNTPSVIDNARVLAYQMSQTGLKVTLESYEWGTFYSDIQSGNFQLATMRWVGVIDPDIYRLAFHSKEVPPGRNRGLYINEKLDRLVEQGLETADESKRAEIYRRVQEMIFHEVAIIPLWYDKQVSIVHRRVHGYEPWQTSDFFPFLFVWKQASSSH